jgi:phosphoserine aminotransferase
MTIYNFSAGPAVLPKDVLQQVQAEMVDWHGSGMSVMEMSHRGKEFTGIIQPRRKPICVKLMGIPANYKVLFLQGGASLPVRDDPDQPAARQSQLPTMSIPGIWSEEGDQGRQGVLQRSTWWPTSAKTGPSPMCQTQADWQLDRRMPPICITRPNETIGGVEMFNWIPETPAMCRWCATCPPTSCRGRSM